MGRIRGRDHYEGRHLAGSNTGFVLDFLLGVGSAELVAEVLDAAGESRSVEDLSDPAVWSSYDQFRRLLEAVSQRMGGPAAIEGIGSYVFESPNQVQAPELVSAVLSLGSPETFFATISSTVAAVAPVIEMGAEQLAVGDWELQLGVKAGFEPYPELCHLIMGMNAAVPKLFGQQGIPTTQDRCQCTGAPMCRQRIRWTPSAPVPDAAHFEFHRRLYEARLDGLQRTVGELVSGQRLESLLPRIVAAAARAVQAPAYVLAITDPSSGKRRIYCNGIDLEHAEHRLDNLLADPSKPPSETLVASVASGRVDYGHLVGMRSSGAGFSEQEVSTLASYADLAAAALDSATALDEARHQAAAATALLELSTSLVQVTTLAELGTRLAHAVPQVIDCDRAVVTVVVGDEGSTAQVLGAYNYPPDDQQQILSSTFSLREHPGAQEFTIREPSTGQSATSSIRDAIGSVLTATLPICYGETILGWITADVTDRPERLRDRHDVARKLEGLAGQAAIAISNAQLLERIRSQALHDSLTALPNRPHMLEKLERGLGRAKQEGGRIAVLFVDLDGFKGVNDHLGHEAGDQLLQAVARRLESAVRRTDVVGRLGGDEFVILLQGESSATPAMIAERIRCTLAQPFPIGAHSPVTISASIGIAEGDRDSGRELLRDADAALYAAKAAGRNRAAVFQPART